MQKVAAALVHANELVTASSDSPKCGEALQDLGIIEDGAIVFDENGIIAVGSTQDILLQYQPEHCIDVSGKVVLPGLVDPHTHLPYAGSRHVEYEHKVSGKSYSDLHETGGIRFSVRMTRAASEEDLVKQALKDLDIMMLHGTTLVEAKSGYGLDEENELKLLRVIQKVNDLHVLDVVPTFLGAHTVPDEYLDDRSGYIELVKELIPKVVDVAEFCDVWCDPLGFTCEETQEVFEVAKAYGMLLKIHSEQTGCNHGTELAAQMKATSADHLDFVSSEGIRLMKEHGTIPVLLPGVTYHLMEFEKEIPIQEMLEANLPIALATDYNPGSCRTQSMQTIMEMAMRIYKLNYAEAIHAATINAAYAVNRGARYGSLDVGKAADIIVCDCEAHGVFLNSFGVNQVDTVIKHGKVVVCNKVIQEAS